MEILWKLKQFVVLQFIGYLIWVSYFFTGYFMELNSYHLLFVENIIKISEIYFERIAILFPSIIAFLWFISYQIDSFLGSNLKNFQIFTIQGCSNKEIQNIYLKRVFKPLLLWIVIFDLFFFLILNLLEDYRIFIDLLVIDSFIVKFLIIGSLLIGIKKKTSKFAEQFQFDHTISDLDLEYEENKARIKLQNQNRHRKLSLGYLISSSVIFQIILNNTLLQSNLEILYMIFVVIFLSFVFIVPYYVGSIIFEKLSLLLQGFFHLFTKFNKNRNKKYLDNLFSSLSKQNFDTSRTTFVLLIFLISSSLILTSFHTFKSNFDSKFSDLNWDNADVCVQLHTTHFSNNPTLFATIDSRLLTPSQEIHSSIKLTITEVGEFAGFSSYETPKLIKYSGVVIEPMNYYHFITKENIQMKNCMENLSNFEQLFRYLQNYPDSIIISSALASAKNLKLNDTLALTSTFDHNAQYQPFRIIAIFDSAPLVQLDQISNSLKYSSPIHIIFGSNWNFSLYEIKYFLKTNPLYGTEDITSQLTTIFESNFESISYKSDLLSYPLTYLASEFSNQFILVVIFLVIAFQSYISERFASWKKSLSILDAQGVSKKDQWTLINWDISILVILITIITFGIGFCLNLTLFDLGRFIVYLQLNQLPRYINLIDFLELLNSSRGNDITILGKYISIPFTVNFSIYLIIFGLIGINFIWRRLEK